MADDEAGLTVQLIPRSELPPGVTVSAAPSTSTQAIAFTLEPEVSEDSSEVLTSLSEPQASPSYEAPTTYEPEIREVTEIITKTKEVELPLYSLVPREVGAGTYLGVVWATSEKEAKEIIVAQFGGAIEEYTFDLFNNGPRPYFVIRNPPLQGEAEAATPRYSASASSPSFTPVAPPAGQVQCKNCLSYVTLPDGQKEIVCPICGTLVTSS